jgi:hypothetical protein
MRRILQHIGQKAYRVRHFYELGQIYKRYNAFTMIDKYTYIKNLELRTPAAKFPGAWSNVRYGVEA